jgi:hypothetical protein
MTLRFQKEDEVDQEVKEQSRIVRHVSLYGFCFVIFAGVAGLSGWLSGESLKSYWGEIRWGAAAFLCIGVADWHLSPIYNEFRFRTKEIDGKLDTVLKNQAEILEKMNRR